MPRTISPAKEPVRYFGAPARLNVDREIWKKRVRELSRLFTASPLIFESRVELTASAETKYYLNTEKTAVFGRLVPLPGGPLRRHPCGRRDGIVPSRKFRCSFCGRAPR